VTGGTRANKAFVIDVRTLELVKVIPVDIAPEHLSFSPDSRWYYQGNPDGDSISVIDMVSLTKIKTIPGLVEPLNVTFLPDGSKAYVGNYGAHWIGVIDAKRHELAKRIQFPLNIPIAPNSENLLGEINGIINVTLTRDGKYGYAADADLNSVAIIDTRNDELVKMVPIGKAPWRAYASTDGKTMWIPNNGDATVSVLDTKKQDVIATFEAGPDMVGVNFANGKAYVISSSSGFVYVYDLKSLLPKGRISFGKDTVLETAATDAAGKKIYLCSSNKQVLYEIDTKTDKFVEIPDVGFFPWGSHVMNGPDNYCH